MSLQHQASPITSIRLVTALAALTAVLAGAPEAAACECLGRGGVQPSSTSTKVPTNTKVWVLQIGCNSHTVRNWDFDSDGPAVDTRLGAFDYAGNFSGWSEPKTLEGACGCEVAGADRSQGYGILALGVLGIAALRRRRD